jgi:hypothetical protein
MQYMGRIIVLCIQYNYLSVVYCKKYIAQYRSTSLNFYSVLTRVYIHLACVCICIYMTLLYPACLFPFSLHVLSTSSTLCNVSIPEHTCRIVVNGFLLYTKHLV